MAEDEQVRRLVREGKTEATPEWGHSVHVEVSGVQPDRWYWYRVQSAGEQSPLGRTRTFPARDMMSEQFRFAFASCQHFEQGLFTAYQHMVNEPLDAVVHLGDYIYEGAGANGRVRQHHGGEIHTLEEYRTRYAQYKTDPHLQAAHATFPWIVTWDDHEFDNNYADDISEEPDVAAADFLKRRAYAYQAYWENMPLRRATLPDGPNLPLYRRLAFGNLAEFYVLDTRQYRTDQPCGDRNGPPCKEAYDPDATLLGKAQEQWLLDGFRSSPSRWNILAQQVMMARVDRTPGDILAYSMDQWPGYEVNRRRMLDFFARQKGKNPVVLTGDIHSNWVNDLQVETDTGKGDVVATEFVGTSISSAGDGSATREDTEGVLAENPFVKFYNSERGYVRCELTPEVWRSDFRVVPFVTRPGAEITTRASFTVENGRPGAVRS